MLSCTLGRLGSSKVLEAWSISRCKRLRCSALLLTSIDRLARRPRSGRRNPQQATAMPRPPPGQLALTTIADRQGRTSAGRPGSASCIKRIEGL